MNYRAAGRDFRSRYDAYKYAQARAEELSETFKVFWVDENGCFGTDGSVAPCKVGTGEVDSLWECSCVECQEIRG